MIILSKEQDQKLDNIWYKLQSNIKTYKYPHTPISSIELDDECIKKLDKWVNNCIDRLIKAAYRAS